MTVLNTSFEQLIMSDSPVLLCRISHPTGVEVLATKDGTGPAFAMNRVVGGSNQGVLQTPSAGIFASSSLRFNGNVTPTYAVSKFFPTYQPTKAFTILLVVSRLRSTGPASAPSPNNNTVMSIFSCAQSGGIGILTSSVGMVEAWVRIGGGYFISYIENNALDASRNLLHITFDGSSIRFYVNGAIAAATPTPAASVVAMSNVPWMIGADPDSSGSAENGSCIDCDLSVVGVFDKCLTDNAISNHYYGWSNINRLSGIGRLDTMAQASEVIVTSASTLDAAAVTPNSDGSWSANVEAGDYYVTTLGPSGYQPITHGPVTAVASA